MASSLQLDMFGAPEKADERPYGRHDDAPVPSERENLWPGYLVEALGQELLERLYGDVPRRTRLYVREVCRRLRCDSGHVYNLIDSGSLDATDIRTPEASRAEWRVYRYSLVAWLFARDFGGGAPTRNHLSAEDLRRIERAVAARERNP